MPWLALCTAVVTEIIWGLSLKWAPTTSRPLVAALIPIVLSFLNMGLLSYAMRFLPAGLSYALWTGLGSIGVAVGGMLFFQDRISLPQAGFMLLILVGCIGARLAAPQDWSPLLRKARRTRPRSRQETGPCRPRGRAPPAQPPVDESAGAGLSQKAWPIRS